MYGKCNKLAASNFMRTAVPFLVNICNTSRSVSQNKQKIKTNRSTLCINWHHNTNRFYKKLCAGSHFCEASNRFVLWYEK